MQFFFEIPSTSLLNTFSLKGQAKSVVDGVPIAIKDNICTERMQTTCGSKMLEGILVYCDSCNISLSFEKPNEKL